MENAQMISKLINVNDNKDRITKKVRTTRRCIYYAY